ncbi:MAG: hypothetical protein FJ280_27485 [Planctomycetes bacterium]|nr:hypothetical protein [Planctomycetota bacterium]
MKFESTVKLFEVLVIDVLFSLLLSLTGEILADLGLPLRILTFSVTIFPLAVLFVQALAFILQRTGKAVLHWGFWFVAGLCLVSVTVYPLSFVGERFYNRGEQIALELGRKPTPVRLSTPAPTIVFPLSTMPAPTVRPFPSSTPDRGLTPTLTPTATPRPRATETPQGKVLPAPSRCAIEAAGIFRDVWQQEGLGCPSGQAQTTWAAWQPFERGAMLWREDHKVIAVFYAEGQWQAFADLWQEGQPASDSSLSPPTGLVQPVRGFGKVWRERQGVRARLGWAKQAEQGLCITLQEGQGGDIMIRYEIGDRNCSAPQGYSPPGMRLGLALRGSGAWRAYW